MVVHQLFSQYSRFIVVKVLKSTIGTAVFIALSLLLILVTQVVQAQSIGQLELKVLDSESQVTSSDLLTVQLVLENNNGVVLDLSPDFSLPEGWQFVSIPSRIKLDAGERVVVTLPVLIPSSAAAGQYELELNYRTQSEVKQVIATVEVLSNEAISMRLVSSPRLSSEDFEVVFQVSNQGNQLRNLALEVSDNSATANKTAHTSNSAPLSLDLSTNTLELAPGEVADIRVAVKLTALERSMTQRLRLELFDNDGTNPQTFTSNSAGQRLLAVAQSSTRLVPANLSEAAAIYSFPLNFKVTGRLNQKSFSEDVFSSEGLFSQLNMRLSGEADLGALLAGRLAIDLGPKTQKLSYALSTEQFRTQLKLGAYDFRMSALDKALLKSSGFGAGLDLEFSDLPTELPLEFRAAIYSESGVDLLALEDTAFTVSNSMAALQLSTSLSDAFKLTGTYRQYLDNSDGAISATASYQPDFTTQVESSELDEITQDSLLDLTNLLLISEVALSPQTGSMAAYGEVVAAVKGATVRAQVEAEEKDFFALERNRYLVTTTLNLGLAELLGQSSLPSLGMNVNLNHGVAGVEGFEESGTIFSVRSVLNGKLFMQDTSLESLEGQGGFFGKQGLTWSLRHLYEQTPSFDSATGEVLKYKEQQDLRGSVNYTIGEVQLKHALAINLAENNFDVINLGLETSASIETALLTLKPFVAANFHFENDTSESDVDSGSALQDWRVGLSAETQNRYDFDLNGSADLRVGDSTQLALGAGLAYPLDVFGYGHKLELNASTQFDLSTTDAASESNSWQLTMGYSLPIDVPLGRRNDIARIEGQVLNEDVSKAKPIVPENIVIELVNLDQPNSSQAVLSQADGSFVFPAVEAGDYSLSILPETLDFSFLSAPASVPLRVEAGEVQVPNLSIVPAAVLEGQLRFATPKEAKRYEALPQPISQLSQEKDLKEESDKTEGLPATEPEDKGTDLDNPPDNEQGELPILPIPRQ